MTNVVMLGLLQWLQAAYWIISLVAGITTWGYESNKRRGSKLHRVVDYLHSSLSFPIGIVSINQQHSTSTKLIDDQSQS